MVTSETERMIQIVEMRLMKLRGRDKALIDEGMREFRRELDALDEKDGSYSACIDALDKRMDRIEGELNDIAENLCNAQHDFVVLTKRVIALECPGERDRAKTEV